MDIFTILLGANFIPLFILASYPNHSSIYIYMTPAGHVGPRSINIIGHKVYQKINFLFQY
jgi:hypothetical protein